MDKQTVTTGGKPKVFLNVQGDLRLKGDEEAVEVSIKASSPDYELKQDGDNAGAGMVWISCRSDCSVRVPRQAQVQVSAVHGDAVCKALEGELVIEEVHGSLTLRSVGKTHLKKLHGNLQARNLDGGIEIDTVDGNAVLRDVQGDFSAGCINGNLNLDDVDGSVAARVKGNAILSLDPTPGQEYQVTADGNLVLHIPADASALVSIGKAGHIVVDLEDIEVPKDLAAPCEFTLGEGETEVKLSAGGNILISGFEPNMGVMPDIDIEVGEEMDSIADNIGQQIAEQIEAQMQLFEQQLSAQMASLTTALGTPRLGTLPPGTVGLSPEQLERIQQRAREASERASERMQERMKRAQEKLERKVAATQRRVEQKARTTDERARRREKHAWQFSWNTGIKPPVPAAPPVSPIDPVSEEERLVILRMLEQKKISLEQAEKLLSALEGKEA